MVFVIYLGARSTMRGMKAKSERLTEEEELKNLPENNTDMISELEKLNELYKSGALSEEEFNKAKTINAIIFAHKDDVFEDPKTLSFFANFNF